MDKSKRWLSVAAGVLAAAHMGFASANLIFDDNIDAKGTGFGTQDNILTLHNAGGAGAATDTEDGTVAWTGTAQTCTGNDVVCTSGQTDFKAARIRPSSSDSSRAAGGFFSFSVTAFASCGRKYSAGVDASI